MGTTITKQKNLTCGKVIISLGLALLLTQPALPERKRDFIKSDVGASQDLPTLAKVGSKQTRLKAIRKCGGGRYTFCVRALIDNLKDADPDIRRESAQYLGVLGKSAADKPLMRAIEDEAVKDNPNEDVMAAMILALGYIKSPDSATFLYDYLVCYTGDAPDPAEKKEDLSGNTKVEKCSENHPKLVREEIDPNTQKSTRYPVTNGAKTRRIAAHALGIIGNLNSLVILKKHLKSERVERNHVDFLRSIIILENTRDHRKQLIELLESRNRWVRYYAADYIIDLKIREAVQPLEQALQIEGDEIVRERLYKAYLAAVYRDFPD